MPIQEAVQSSNMPAGATVAYKRAIELRDTLIANGMLRRVNLTPDTDPRREGDNVGPETNMFRNIYPWGVHGTVSGVETYFTLPKLHFFSADHGMVSDYLQVIVLDELQGTITSKYDSRCGFRIIGEQTGEAEYAHILRAILEGRKVTYSAGRRKITIIGQGSSPENEDSRATTENFERNLVWVSSDCSSIIRLKAPNFSLTPGQPLTRPWDRYLCYNRMSDLPRSRLPSESTRIVEPFLDNAIPGRKGITDHGFHWVCLPLVSWDFCGVIETERKVVYLWNDSTRSFYTLSDAAVAAPTPTTPFDFAGLYYFLRGDIRNCSISGPSRDEGFLIWKNRGIR